MNHTITIPHNPKIINKVINMKTYTQKEVLAEKNKAFEDGKRHATPSGETMKRLSSLEKVLAVLVEKVDTIHNTQEKILEQTTKHNGRMKALEVWRARLEGGGVAMKGVWGVLGVFVVAAGFGLFNMYLQLNNLNATIREVVRDELNNYELEIVQ